MCTENFILGYPATPTRISEKEKNCIVEHIGLEPITSTLPVSRSSQMS